MNDKLGRAEEHIRTVFDIFDEYAKAHLHDIVFYFHLDTGTWHGPHETFPPRELGLVAGDAIHNLRASLDYLAWGLVEAAGLREPDESVAFPLYLSDPRKAKPPRAFKLDGYVSDVVLAEIERLQPYNAGHPSYAAMTPLGMLRELANVEKHRYLALGHPQIGPGSFFRPRLVENGPEVRFRLDGLTDNGALLKPADPEMEVYGQAMLVISVPQSVPIGQDPPAFPKADEPLLGTLVKLQQTVRQIADALIAVA